jgi:ketosteroid isomerase-like protein
MTSDTPHSRRAAIACGVLAPFGAAQAQPGLDAVAQDLARRAELQARLFNTGAMERWVEVADPAESFTLMQPFGGPATRGFDRSPAHLAALSAAFRDGDARIDLVQAVTSDSVAVLAYVERQEIAVLGLPKQDWSLRVTQVFQRQGAAWKLVHRHADPLVRPVLLQQAAALAAGRATDEADARNTAPSR